MSVVDFNNYLMQQIQAGSQVDGTAVRIITDNGTDIGEGVFKVIEGGNGVASEVGIATQTGTSGPIATGMAYLTMSVPTALAAVAPALGVLAGIGLYNLFPEQFNEIGEACCEAGETIGGKIIAYWDGVNTYLSENVINIIKNKLLEWGAFDIKYESTIDDTTGLDTTNLTLPIQATNKVTCYNDPRYVYDYLADGDAHFAVYLRKNYNQSGYDRINIFAASQNPFNVTRYYMGAIASVDAATQIVYNHKAFYSLSVTMDMQDSLLECNYNDYTQMPGMAYDRTIEYILAYGNTTQTSGLPLQEDAIYPDSSSVTSKYPYWFPHIYPPTVLDPVVLPIILPIEFPNIDPAADQSTAQDPAPEPVEIIIPIILPEFPIPAPGYVDPEPQEEEDPDEDEDEDPIDDDEEKPKSEDPVDPNRDPEAGTPPVIPNVPDTVSSNKLFTVYNPTSSQLDALGGYLWDASLIATLRDIWQDPLDGIISLIQVYATPSTGGSHNIILGFLDSGISSQVVSNQFTEIDCGSVTINEDKKNATDYSPYTEVHLYLPFIGIVSLDVNECMNGTLSVKYRVDVYTGTCLALVSVTRTKDMPSESLLYTFSGNCSQQIPLTSGNAVGVLSALVGAIGTALSVPSGGKITTALGAKMLGESMQHELFHVSHSGNISANAGIMGPKKPFVIISRRHCYDANNYNSYYGYPANKTVYLGNHTGFVRVKKCWIKTKALQEEYNEIMRLLEEGVFV